jgi:hypothetical protein
MVHFKVHSSFKAFPVQSNGMKQICLKEGKKGHETDQ